MTDPTTKMLEQLLSNIAEAIKHLEVVEVKINTLYDAIAHGDDKHRAWLKEAIESHFSGKPVSPPR